MKLRPVFLLKMIKTNIFHWRAIEYDWSLDEVGDKCLDLFLTNICKGFQIKTIQAVPQNTQHNKGQNVTPNFRQTDAEYSNDEATRTRSTASVIKIILEKPAR